MKKLIVHVGHGKTGSSFLQSVFSLNSDKMAQLGIFYPEHQSFSKARRGYISSGNGSILLEKDRFDTTHPTILVSSEVLFTKLLQKQEYVANLSKLYDLEVVIYLRDVIDHRVSLWGQYVKRGGGYQDLHTFLLTQKYNALDLVLKWIKLSNETDFTLILKNYSKCKNNLAQDFFNDALNAPSLAEKSILPGNTVNRSLSYSELEIQRVFNAAFGKSSSRYVADFLCNNFPDVKAWTPTLNEHIYEEILAENTASVDAINSVLDDTMHLEIGRREDWVNGETEELTTLDSDLCKELGNNILQNNASLDQSSVNEVRDAALRLFDKDPGAIEDALALMKIAHKHRPNGPLIKGKVEQWSALLDSSENE
jgi:hypothetical protein